MSVEKIKIGIICPSEIAFRRFMPALIQCEEFEYAGVAVANSDEWGGEFSDEMRKAEYAKAQKFVEEYGGEIFDSYTALLTSDKIDAVYLPLPPALHYKWGMQALENSKHLFCEKPSTTSYNDTKKLIEFAESKNLAVHENYMFRFHSQIDYTLDCIKNGRVGDVRLFRISFGFPMRSSNDFRYNKALGGGALLDAGGYTLKLASILLGDSARVKSSKLNYIDGYEVDMFGSATLENKDGIVAQTAFGMDNCYKCELEIWGSKGTMFFNRILTAPAGFSPEVQYKYGNEPVQTITLDADDSFKKSINYFKTCIDDENVRKESHTSILNQAKAVDVIRKEN